MLYGIFQSIILHFTVTLMGQDSRVHKGALDKLDKGEWDGILQPRRY